MLATIRKRKSALDQMEQLILAEFGESRNGASAEPNERRKPKRHSLNGTSRKDQMHAWLKKNGPAERKSIVEGTGFPDGTIGSYLSTETKLFEKRDGQWQGR